MSSSSSNALTIVDTYVGESYDMNRAEAYVWAVVEAVIHGRAQCPKRVAQLLVEQAQKGA